MPRKYRRKFFRSRSFGRRVAAQGMAWGWWRPGPLVLTTLNAATLESQAIVAAGTDLISQPAAVLDMSRRVNPRIARIIMRLTVQVVSALGAILLEYWWGWRFQELTTAGGFPTGALPSVFVAGAGDKREDWIYRGQGAVFTVAASNQVILGDGGSPIIFADIKPKRDLPYGHALIFQQGIRVSGGGAMDANVQVGTQLNAEVGVQVPR